MPQSVLASKLFANPTRRTIIELLREKPHTTGALCDRFELSRFAVMQHLKVLEQAGIVSAEKRGRYRWNHLNLERLVELKSQIPTEPDRVIPDSMTMPPLVNAAHFVTEYVYNTTPNRLFKALTRDVDHWWAEPRVSRSSQMHLEAYLGGRLHEQFSRSGDGILYGTIDQFKRDERLGFMGTMGSDAVISLVRMRLDVVDDGQTSLALRHSFIGEIGGSTLEAFQQSWQRSLGVQLKGLIQVAVDNQS